MDQRRLVALLCAAATIAAAVTFGGPGEPTSASPAPDGSGGKAVAHRAGGKVVAATKRPDARLYRTGALAIEPTIGINKKGHIFFTAGRDLDVLRSRDEGATWEVVSPLLPTGQRAHVITLDPYIYLDESTGRLFDIDLTVACSYLSFSDDGGGSWTTNPLACGRPVNDHQTLFGGPPAISPTVGFDEIVYYCWNDFGLGTSCSKSLDGGITWIGEGQAFFGYQQEDQGGARRCGGFNGHGVVGEDGTVYLPKEWCGQPWLGISYDEGLTWEQVQVATNTTEYFGSDTSVAVDAKGNLYYTYESAKQKLYLVTSTDGGQTWSDPLMVGAPQVDEVSLPTLDVGDPGKVAIGYMGTTESPFKKCEPQCTSEDYKDVEWNGYITMTVDSLSRNPLFYSATVNNPADPLYRGRCDFFTRCGPILDFMDIEVSPDGTPYAAYVDACMDQCPAGGPAGTYEGVVGRLVGGPRLR